MSDLSTSMMVHRPQLTLLQKAFALSSWFLAGAMFLTIGWFALEPDDPLGAVSLLERDGGLIMLVQAAALAGAAAAMATVIIGRHLADVGTFAAALGLAAVSLRGGNAGVLLLSYADVADSVDRWLAVRFALEAVGWFAVILVAVGVSAVVMSWCNPRLEGSSANPGSTQDIAAATMAGYDVPGIGPRLFQSTWDTSTPLTDGLKHTGIAAGVGLLVIVILSAGLSTRGIQHGQACFMVAAAVWIASYVAFRAVPVRSAFWPMLAVPIVAIAGYAWALIQPSTAQAPPNLPASHFLRVLPIQYISVGTVAVLVMFWSRVIPASYADGDEGAGKPSRRGVA